jgi:hypothetical protein
MSPAKDFTHSKASRRGHAGELHSSNTKIEKGSHARARRGAGCVQNQAGVIDADAQDAIIDLFREFTQTFAGRVREIEQASIVSYQKGYAAGIIAGKRLAKGKSQFPKPRGGQKTLPDILALHFFDFVAESKMNVAAAASSFRGALIRFGGIPEKEIPSLAALMRLYQRMLTEKHKIDKSDRDVYDQLNAYYSRT